MTVRETYSIDGKDIPGKFEDTEFGHVFLFDQPVAITNGQVITITYIVIKYWEGCEPDGDDANVAGSDHQES